MNASRSIAARRSSEGSSEPDPYESAEPVRILTLSVPREDAWLFEGMLILAKHLGENTLSDATFALVTEATTTAIERWPEQSFVVNDCEGEYPGASQRTWEAELQRTLER